MVWAERISGHLSAVAGARRPIGRKDARIVFFIIVFLLRPPRARRSGLKLPAFCLLCLCASGVGGMTCYVYVYVYDVT